MRRVKDDGSTFIFNFVLVVISIRITNLNKLQQTYLFELVLPIVITVRCTLMVAQHIQRRRHRIKARKTNLDKE